MKLSENDFKNYTAILREELIPAMGCTEPHRGSRYSWYGRRRSG